MEELLGIAIGAMGMDLESFRQCTPGEFRAVYDSWFSHQEMLMHRDWEVGRFIATTAVQPYSNKPLKPTDLIRFPWEEDDGTGAAVPKGTSSKEKMEELWKKWKGQSSS
ncbi:MAG: hypothetical protein IKI66_10395 [Bacteroidales bacterium]|nr:hypothetical protein [Bacteroidales bacterium]